MDIQDFKDLLHERNLKATNPRLNLLMHMYNYKSAMPYSAIQDSMKPIDRVTLYRTLESLQSQGIIHKAYQENNETYFAMCGVSCKKNEHSHDHIHFKCTSCELVTCEKLKKAVTISIPEYQINRTSIFLEGICKMCKDQLVA